MKILIVRDSNHQHSILTNWISDLKKMGHEVKTPSFEKKLYRIKFLNSNSRISYFINIFNLNGIIKLRTEVGKFNPDLIWFHNINNSWSWSTLLVPVKKKCVKIITLHDLSSIYFNKIVPRMLNNSFEFLFFELGIIKGSLHKLRHLIIRKLLLKANVISIGKIQDKILQANGIKITKRIENYIPACVCDNKNFKRVDSKVLFAGRANYKGLDIIARSVLESKGWILLAAGGQELNNFLKTKLPSTKMVYLGDLPNSELCKYIHESKFVAVLSQCYDNFPTIGLEALVHGSLPITTDLTGVAEISRKISRKLVFKVNEVPDLNMIDRELYVNEFKYSLDIDDFSNKDIFFTNLFSVLKNDML